MQILWPELKAHIQKFVNISDDEYDTISRYLQKENLAKKHLILKEGQVCKNYYFVLKGILRKYFINEKGIEQTIQFAMENWWMAEDFSLLLGQPSQFYIQAVEKAETLTISKENMDKLCMEHPLLNQYLRIIYQKAYAASQMRLKYVSEMSREQFFKHFQNHYPEFLQRIPQYMVASYLGFTPEYLSEIRKKSIS